MKRAAALRFLRTLMIVIASVSVALAGAAPSPTWAQVTVAPPLTGETFYAASGLAGTVGTISVSANCSPPRPTISYRASGPVVAGPYPGAYRESGTAVLSQVSEGETVVPLVSFVALFTIDSPTGRVIGTKRLDTSDPRNALLGGYCVSAPAAGVGSWAFDVYATYDAVIATETGTCTTEGSAVASVFEAFTPSLGGETFNETFLTGTPPVCQDSQDEDDDDEDDDDEDDDGDGEEDDEDEGEDDEDDEDD